MHAATHLTPVSQTRLWGRTYHECSSARGRANGCIPSCTAPYLPALARRDQRCPRGPRGFPTSIRPLYLVVCEAGLADNGGCQGGVGVIAACGTMLAYTSTGAPYGP